MPFARPFRAISLCVSFPGLKPWAVFCSPVGRLELAQENVQTPGPFGTKAIRRNVESDSMAFQKRTKLFLRRKSAVMLGLIGNVGGNGLYARLAD